MMKDKKILDVTCAARSIWFNKNHPAALYTDIRKEYHTMNGRVIDVDPDMIVDFRDMPFQDNSFHLVVFDPPHMYRKNGFKKSSWMANKYGQLFATWETDIKAGYSECMRVLKPNGILIFKWNEINISKSKILEVIGEMPLFGHTMMSNEKTHWLTFMKINELC